MHRIPAQVWTVAAVAAVAVAGFAWLRSRAATALDPTDPNNLAYSGVNAVGAALSGDGSFSLGGAIYDLGHSDPTNAAPSFNPDSWARHLRLTGTTG